MKSRTRLPLTLLVSLFVQIAEADVTLIEMSAPVPVYDVSDPNFSWGHGPSPPEVIDAGKLRLIHGAGSEEEFSTYLADGPPEERALAKAVSGGTLKLTYVQGNKQLTAVVTYKASRKLDSNEVEQLREYTYGQLLDGVGGNFQQAYAERRERLWIAFEDIPYDEFRVTADPR